MAVSPKNCRSVIGSIADRLLAALRVAVAASAVGNANATSGIGELTSPFAVQFENAELVQRSMAAAERLDLQGARVTGITVPHHSVAADLIASGFLAAARTKPERLVVLFPDHFKRSAKPFATTRRDFKTAVGLVRTDKLAVRELLRAPDVKTSGLFAREHGLGILLPYIRSTFPGVPIVPIAIAIGSKRQHWDALVGRLRPLVSRRTLIVQSTDFSHYLSRPQAIRRDQETLNIISAGDLDALARTIQPDHIDSKGAQYIQMRLQETVFGARAVVFANRNSEDFMPTGLDRTTSYVAQVFTPDRGDRVLMPTALSRTQTFCFAGDTFFGRHVARFLARPEVAARVRRALVERLAGCRLIVNLEGVLTSDPADESRDDRLAMLAPATIDWLRALNVEAVSVANNHSHDLGEPGYAAMVATLRRAGIRVLEHAKVETIGPIEVVALRDLDNHPRFRDELVGDAEIDALPPVAAGRARIAFLHWGREYDADPGERERHLTERLRLSGVRLIVGAHPHRASAQLQAPKRGEALLAYSLGNFIFDQHGPRVSGAVLQVSVLEQGTFAARWLRLPSVRELGRAAR